MKKQSLLLKTFSIILTSSLASYAVGKTYYEAPEDLTYNFEVAVKIRCDERKVLELSKNMDQSQLIMRTANPHVIGDLAYRQWNVLNIDNRNYSDLQKYMDIESSSGKVKIRAHESQPFMYVGHIDSDVCKDNVYSEYVKRCEKAGYSGAEEMKLCTDSLRNQMLKGIHGKVTFIPDQNMKISLKRTARKCSNKWGGLDPETTGEYKVSIKIAVLGQETEFSPITDSDTFSSKRECENFNDGWGQ